LGEKTAENLFLGFGCWRKRNFAKVSKGEKILQTAVPLIEQIDELFFGKLDNNEEQFKHFLVRLNKE